MGIDTDRSWEGSRLGARRVSWGRNWGWGVESRADKDKRAVVKNNGLQTVSPTSLFFVIGLKDTLCRASQLEAANKTFKTFLGLVAWEA